MGDKYIKRAGLWIGVYESKEKRWKNRFHAWINNDAALDSMTRWFMRTAKKAVNRDHKQRRMLLKVTHYDAPIDIYLVDRVIFGHDNIIYQQSFDRINTTYKYNRYKIRVIGNDILNGKFKLFRVRDEV